jgi:hypothetical protein
MAAASQHSRGKVLKLQRILRLLRELSGRWRG